MVWRGVEFVLIHEEVNSPQPPSSTMPDQRYMQLATKKQKKKTKNKKRRRMSLGIIRDVNRMQDIQIVVSGWIYKTSLSRRVIWQHDDDCQVTLK